MRLLFAAVLLALGLPLAAAERVVSLAPALSEIVLELGAGERLVGMLDGDQRPAALAGVASVGRYGQLNMEALLSLKPDLILLWPASIPQEQREQLQRFGIPLYSGEPSNFAELAEQFAEVGRLLGVPERGNALARDFLAGMQRLRSQYQRESPLPVFYQVWHEPPYTIGGKQIISEALGVCGARNVFADLELPAAQVSVESVLQRDPALILASNPAGLAIWKPWAQLQAVRRQQLWAVPDRGL
ncbi:MAG TPA: cobalamin-binding protein, partial [Pseudomonas sp.]|nr:cobalamin-binding protein [Pseudomonas sp.]